MHTPLLRCGQNIIEHILLVTVVIIVLLGFMLSNGKVGKSQFNSFVRDAFNTAEDVLKKEDTAITFKTLDGSDISSAVVRGH